MDKSIMVACDLHDQRMLLKLAQGRRKAEKRSFGNNRSGRKALLAELRRRSKRAAGAKVIFAYEASGQGFGLYDELTEAGFECHVLAPTRIARSVKHRRTKTDEKDADQILEVLRGHVLAGNELPSVWVPDPETREDREVVRARLEVAEKLARLKAKVRTLLKRNGILKAANLGQGWTTPYRAWLGGLLRPNSRLSCGAQVGLSSLLRQMKALEHEVALLDQAVESLADTPRHAEPVRAILPEKGVGLLTAMVFLTEMGDLSRFSNRRQVGAYLGLVPSTDESGESNDRKGHITHHGNARIRKVLCQATWARVRTHPEARAAYQRVVARNPQHKKIAVVASMRRLAIRLWHRAFEPQRRARPSPGPAVEAVA